MKTPKKPTMKLCILAHCHQCLGYFQDGRIDCQNVRCPLYPFMPYRKMDPDLEWLKYNPKRAGKVKYGDCGRDLTDEQKKKLSENIKKVHAARKEKGKKDD